MLCKHVLQVWAMVLWQFVTKFSGFRQLRLFRLKEKLFLLVCHSGHFLFSLLHLNLGFQGFKLFLVNSAIFFCNNRQNLLLIIFILLVNPSKLFPLLRLLLGLTFLSLSPHLIQLNKLRVLPLNDVHHLLIKQVSFFVFSQLCKVLKQLICGFLVLLDRLWILLPLDFVSNVSTIAFHNKVYEFRKVLLDMLDIDALRLLLDHFFNHHAQALDEDSSCLDIKRVNHSFLNGFHELLEGVSHVSDILLWLQELNRASDHVSISEQRT